MEKNIYLDDFVNEFKRYGREENFTYAGLKALFDFIEELEIFEDEWTLDVIALCCEFTEYENLEEFQADYGKEYETIEDIENVTTVIMVDDVSFIIQSFQEV